MYAKENIAGCVKSEKCCAKKGRNSELKERRILLVKPVKGTFYIVFYTFRLQTYTIILLVETSNYQENMSSFKGGYSITK